MYLYLSICNFVTEGTDGNGENWYVTNNNQITVLHVSGLGRGHNVGLRDFDFVAVRGIYVSPTCVVFVSPAKHRGT